MMKKVLLLTLILSSLSMVGCIVINNGPEKSSDKTDGNTEKVIVKEDTSSNVSTNNDYNMGNYDSEYVFYDSDIRYLSNSDLQGLSKWELKVARNEIYARHGRLFNDDSLQKYFNSCSWYDGYISADSFNEKVLNDVEKSNVKLIQNYE